MDLLNGAFDEIIKSVMGDENVLWTKRLVVSVAIGILATLAAVHLLRQKLGEE